VGVSYTAAWLSLSERADVQAGETVLVTGASGTAGRAATEIAHWRGARVVGADLTVGDDLATARGCGWHVEGRSRWRRA
jgi:NADPH:quinone reductase-like Zn-dependent oxidoreductase